MPQPKSSAWATDPRKEALRQRDAELVNGNDVDYACIYCETPLTDAAILARPVNKNTGETDWAFRTFDHLVDIATYDAMPDACENAPHHGNIAQPCCKVWFGSKHKSENVATCCKRCNSRRTALSLDCWQYASLYSGATARLLAIVDGRFTLNIREAKLRVNARRESKGLAPKKIRRDYRNCWSNPHRLSQGVGTI